MFDSYKMTYEILRRENLLDQTSGLLELARPRIKTPMMSVLGDKLIRLGLRLKERSYARLNSEDASVPTFLIML